MFCVTIFSSYFQTWAINYACSKGLTPENQAWNIGRLSIHPFSRTLVANDVIVKTNNGSTISLNEIVMYWTHWTANGDMWQLDSIMVDKTHAFITIEDMNAESGSDSISFAQSLFIEVIQFNQLSCDFEQENDTVRTNFQSASVSGLHLGSNLIRGDAVVQVSSIDPLGFNDIWTQPLHLVEVQSSFDIGGSASCIDLNLESNLGNLQGTYSTNASETNFDFSLVGSTDSWPLNDSVTWVQSVKPQWNESTFQGQLAIDSDHAVQGTIAWNDWEIPFKWSADAWETGALSLPTDSSGPRDSESRKMIASLSSFGHWTAEISGDSLGLKLHCFPKNTALRRTLDVEWRPEINPNEITIASFGIEEELFDSKQIGSPWKIQSTISWTNDGVQLDFRANDKSNSKLAGSGQVYWDAERWQSSLNLNLEGLKSQTKSNKWELFAKASVRGNGNWNGDWTQILEVRQITLLEDKMPRAFERLDAIHRKAGDRWTVNWSSDLSNGSMEANSAFLSSKGLEIPESWNSSKQPSGLPYFNIEGNILRFAPIALLGNLPFTLGNNSQFDGSLDGKKEHIAIAAPSFRYDKLEATGIDINVDHIEGTAPILSCQVDEIWWSELLIGSALELALNEQDGWNGELNWDIPDGTMPGNIQFHVQPKDRNFDVFIDSLSVPIQEQQITLVDRGKITWNPNSKDVVFEPFVFESIHGTAQIQGLFNAFDEMDLLLDFQWNKNESRPLVIGDYAVNGLNGSTHIKNTWKNPDIQGQLELDEFKWKHISAKEVSATFRNERFQSQIDITAKLGQKGTLIARAQLPLNNLSRGNVDVRIRDIDLQTINPFLPDETFTLIGNATGRVQIENFIENPRLAGKISTTEAELFIPYLGTAYAIKGVVDIDPNAFYLDQWILTDRQGSKAIFNGTALHEDFTRWSLDFGIDANDSPIILMDIPPSEDAYFFGKAAGLGDINISGFGSNLLFDAQIETAEGTEFSLPLDSQSDVTYADFVRFKTNDSGQTEQILRSGEFSQVNLNLGIDVTPDAQARIIFDRNVGDEIIGNAEGHLDLSIDDFEELNLTGELFIQEGTYNFTLQNWLSKRFEIISGGRIAWDGDPYAAEIDLTTRYATRARLNPLLPNINDLPGRVPVDLNLGLTGSLMRPNLKFEIDVPNSDSRIQALVENALISEEETQRQAISLLVMNQFFNTNPMESSIGGFLKPNQSTQLIANQLGHWISQISPGMEVGLDYDQDDLSGEQALGIAMSTQLLNDRLHIEGEVGAQSIGQIHADDLQVQDLTISYDLNPDGSLQLTGHSRQNPGLSNALEGTQTQGVGLRLKREFNTWGDWKTQD